MKNLNLSYYGYFYKLRYIDLQNFVNNKCNFIMVFTNFCKLILHNSQITLQKNK